MKRSSRALLFALTISMVAACTPSDNGGVIQGPAPSGTTATSTTSTTVANPGGGTLAPG